MPNFNSTNKNDLRIKLLIPELENIVGKEHVLSLPVDLAVYDCDADTLDKACPDLVVLPGCTAEVQQVVKLATIHEIPLVPRGAGTGLSGGAIAVCGGIVLPLTRMTRILEINPDQMTVVVETGVTNTAVSDAVKKYGLYYPPDPSSQKASTIGGNLAENAGGPHTLKYGTTISHVLGATIILPDGILVHLGGKSSKCLGLDLLGTFIGSEGTLGIVTEAILQLTPLPEKVETMMVYFPQIENGGQAVSDIVAKGVIAAAMEMIDQITLQAVDKAMQLGLNQDAGALLIVELDGPSALIESDKKSVFECVANNKGFGVQWAQSQSQREVIWTARKAALSSLGQIAPDGYVLDGVVPRSRLAAAIREIKAIGQKHQITIANVYHAGDGNLHPCLLFHRDNLDEVKQVIAAGKEILKLCVDLGGTLSGEHGIGVEKLAEMSLAFSEPEMLAMSWVHETFNPLSLLNPGKVLPSVRTCGESGVRSLLRYKLSC